MKLSDFITLQDFYFHYRCSENKYTINDLLFVNSFQLSLSSLLLSQLLIPLVPGFYN